MITREDLYSLKQGDKIIDSEGREWSVLSNESIMKGVSEVPGEREVTLLNPDKEPLAVGWGVWTEENHEGIMDSEGGIILTLSDPSAYVIRKA